MQYQLGLFVQCGVFDLKISQRPYIRCSLEDKI